MEVILVQCGEKRCFLFQKTNPNKISIHFQKIDILMFGEMKYPLNKYKSKFVTVGLVYEYNSAPRVKLTGTKNDRIIYTEHEWN